MSEALYQPFPLPGRARGHVWRYAPDQRRPRHFHAEPELNLVVSGRAVFGAGNARRHVKTGDLLSWAPGQDHELIEASSDLDLFVIGLTPELSARALGDTACHPAASAGVSLTGEALAALARRCAAPLSLRDVNATEAHMAAIWQRAHARGSHDLAPMHALTRRTLASVVAAPHLDRAALAMSARGYPTEVSRSFRLDMGMSLTRYRTRLRLMRFVAAMDAGEGTLLAAALVAGFGSYSQCHRVFQSTFGCAPRNFFGTPLREHMVNALAPFPEPLPELQLATALRDREAPPPATPLQRSSPEVTTQPNPHARSHAADPAMARPSPGAPRHRAMVDTSGRWSRHDP